MANLCNLCGTPYQEGAKFCSECGAVLIARMNNADNVETKSVNDEAEIGSEEVSNSEASAANVANDAEVDNSSESSDNAENGPYSENESGNDDSRKNEFTSGNKSAKSNGWGSGSGYSSGNSNYYGSNYNPNNGNPYGSYYGNNYQNKPSRPFNMAILVFSIINLVLGCCSCSGLVFGGGALWMAFMAKKAPTDEEAANP